MLCGDFRGRNAEGANFPDEEARGVVLIGVPYADYSDPVVKAQIEYFNRKRVQGGGFHFISPTLLELYITLLNCCGIILPIAVECRKKRANNTSKY